jgi:uracil-DNA glycosylase family 4
VTQLADVHQALLEGETVTPEWAWARGIQRLAAVVNDLRKSGLDIIDVRDKGERTSAYRIRSLDKPMKFGDGLTRMVVAPGFDSPKSGCLWCPLFPWSPDFQPENYARDHEKICGKFPSGHTVRSRGVTEEWSEVDILFVMDAPREHEDQEDRAISKRDRIMCLETVAVTDVDQKRVGFTNLVRCCTPRDKAVTKTEVGSCSPELLREIGARNPSVIVPFGPKSLEFLTGQKGVVASSGQVLDASFRGLDIPVVPCMSPAYIRRNTHLVDKFIESVKTAASVVTGDFVPAAGEGDYYTFTDLDAVVGLLGDFADSGGPITFDTETGGLSPFQHDHPRLLCFSFSDAEGTACTIPFDHAESPWRYEGWGHSRGEKTDAERLRLEEALRGFFTNPDILKVAQNEKFDRNHIRQALGVEPVNVVDTMLIHLTLDETRGTHGLKTLASHYTGMGRYEAPLNEHIDKNPEANPRKGGSYANIPGELLFKYAAMDADVTLRVYNRLQDEKEYGRKFRNLAETFFPAVSAALGRVEYAGAKIETSRVAEMREVYVARMEKVSQEISALPLVRKFSASREDLTFNPGSDAQLREVLFGYYGEKPTELTDGGLARIKSRWNAVKKKARANTETPPTWNEMVKLAWESGEYNWFSTKADVLQELARRGNELAPLILSYRESETIFGTFIKGMLDRLDDFDCLHGSFLVHGTVTGRLASRNPNLQNIPNKDGGMVKKAFVSRFGSGGCLVQADYSQVELRVAASLFDEPTMIEAYRSGADLHRLTAEDIAFPGREHRADRTASFDGLSKGEQKDWRTRAKRVNFGVLYGGGASAIQNTLKKDGVFLSVTDCQRMVDDYFKMRPSLLRGIKSLERMTKKRGYLESFTGRRRRVPEVQSDDPVTVSRALRQSVNFPVQSGASDITLAAIALIDRALQESSMEAIMVLTVHDSIIFDCPVAERDDLCALVKDIMERVPELSENLLPGVSWDWLQTPLVADLEVGPSWGELEEYEPSDA